MSAAAAYSLLLATFLGAGEVILILALLLILLGARRLPEIMSGLGKGMSQFGKELDRQAHDAGESVGGIYGKPAAEALTPENKTSELYDPAVFGDPRASHGRHRSFHRFRLLLLHVWRSILIWLRMKN